MTTAATLPPHDDFYEQLVARNRGLIGANEQRRLRTARVLIAGCGSIGGAVVEPLIRLGAEHLVLAEPDTYEWHNLNRQSLGVADVGRNKAEVLRERALAVNPYADVAVESHGITAHNVDALVRGSALVIDGVDVTTQEPLQHKYALHAIAAHAGIPVVSGYDIAGVQLLMTYDYRRGRARALDGRVAGGEVASLKPLEFLSRIVPLRALPFEIVSVLRQHAAGEGDGFPQVVYTAQLFGVLAARAAVELLAGRRVRKRVVIDVHSELRPGPARAAAKAAQLGALLSIARDVRRHRRDTTASPGRGTLQEGRRP